MTQSEQTSLAAKYFVDDLPGARQVGGRLHSIIANFDTQGQATELARAFLKSNGLLSLHALVSGHSDLDSFRLATKSDFDLLRQAHKADVEAARLANKAEVESLRQAVRADIDAIGVRVDALRRELRLEQELLRSSMTLRLGSLQVVGLSVLFAALKLTGS